MDTPNDFTGFATLKDLRIEDGRPVVIDLMRQQLVLMSTLSKAARIEVFLKDNFDFDKDPGHEVVITLRGELFWSWTVTSEVLAAIPHDQVTATVEVQCDKAFNQFLKPFDDYWWETLNENQSNGAPT